MWVEVRKVGKEIIDDQINILFPRVLMCSKWGATKASQKQDSAMTFVFEKAI